MLNMSRSTQFAHKICW